MEFTMVRFFGILTLLVPMLIVSAESHQHKIFPYKINQSTLPNGLRIVSIPFDSPGIIAYYTVVRTGSRNEVEPGKSGFAHFFEHMMFRGTEKYPEEKFNNMLKSIGADNNAFTSDDETVYHTVASASALETIMDMESDRFMNLKYSEAAFKTEAGAILGEYNKNSSSPFQTIDEKVRDAAYMEHTYKHSTMGFLKDIEDMPNQYQYSLTFFDRWYRPENCVVVVVGDFDQKKLVSLATKYYGSWKHGSYALNVRAEPPQNEDKFVQIPWKSRTLPILTVAFHGPAFSDTHTDMAALNLFSQLAFGETSDLYKKLVVQDQMVESLSGQMRQNRDPGLFFIFARIKKAKDIAAVRDAIDKTLEEAKTKPVSQSRLADVRSHLKYSFAMRLDDADHVAGTISQFIAMANDPESVNRYYALYDKITPKDIMNVVKKYFVNTNRTVALTQQEDHQ